MEKNIIMMSVIGTTIVFYVGVIVGIWVGISFKNVYGKYCSIKYTKIFKKHKDICNWLKSELSAVKKPKMDKRIDNNKVKLLELLIKKLNIE